MKPLILPIVVIGINLQIEAKLPHHSHIVTNKMIRNSKNITGIIRIKNSCQPSNPHGHSEENRANSPKLFLSQQQNFPLKSSSVLYGIHEIYDGSVGYIEQTSFENLDQYDPSQYFWSLINLSPEGFEETSHDDNNNIDPADTSHDTPELDDFDNADIKDLANPHPAHFIIQLYQDRSLCLSAAPHYPFRLELRNCIEISSNNQKFISADQNVDKLFHENLKGVLKSQVFEFIFPFGLCMQVYGEFKCIANDCQAGSLYLKAINDMSFEKSEFYRINMVEDFQDFLDEIDLEKEKNRKRIERLEKNKALPIKGKTSRSVTGNQVKESEIQNFGMREIDKNDPANKKILEMIESHEVKSQPQKPAVVQQKGETEISVKKAEMESNKIQLKQTTMSDRRSHKVANYKIPKDEMQAPPEVLIPVLESEAKKSLLLENNVKTSDLFSNLGSSGKLISVTWPVVMIVYFFMI